MVNVLFLAADVDLRRARGDSIHVIELTRHLADLGHSITLATATPGDFTISGVHLVRIPKSFAGQVVTLARWARRRSDVLYERRLSPKLAWSIGVIANLPFIVEINGVLSEEQDTQGGRGVSLHSPLRHRIRKKMLSDAFRVVTVSRGIRDSIVSEYSLSPNRVLVIPNGANTTSFFPLAQESCRRELGIPIESRVICFVGNVVAWQGLDDLLRALLRSRQTVPGILLLVLGDGPDLPRLKRLAVQLGVFENARFLGGVPNEAVPKYLCASDLCVAPFRKSRKASPIKVYEYLACARPVVATDIDDVGEFLRACAGGVVVDPDNVNAFADGITGILQNPELGAEMGARGRTAVARDRSWAETARKVAQLIEAAVAN